MPKEPIRLAVILGSTRRGRFGPTVAAWFIDQVSRRGDMNLDVIDLAEVRLPWELSGRGRNGTYESPEVAEYAARIEAADAFVIVTPEYNRGYPAPLKLAIDTVYSEWNAKPVGFVSHGGQSGGLRAVEQLRLVFTELHAMSIRDGICFPNAREQFDQSGALRDAEGAAVAAKLMLDQLSWWAEALRTARADRPYPF